MITISLVVYLFTVYIKYGVLGGGKNISAEGLLRVDIFTAFPNFGKNILNYFLGVFTITQITVSKVVDPFGIGIIYFFESIAITFDQPYDQLFFFLF